MIKSFPSNFPFLFLGNRSIKQIFKIMSSNNGRSNAEISTTINQFNEQNNVNQVVRSDDQSNEFLKKLFVSLFAFSLF